MTTESNSASGPTITSPIVMGGESPQVETPVAEGTSASSDNPEHEIVAGNEPDAQSNADNNPNRSTPEWAQKRINELTAKRYEAERTAASAIERAAAAEKASAELLAKLGGNQNPDPAKPVQNNQPQMTEDEIDRRASEKATQIAATARFNENCNRIAETGEKEFKDWNDALRNLNLVGALGPGASTEFLETAIELRDPHKVLHHLGLHIEEAERITKLPPKKMALEMARVEAMLNTPTPAPTLPPISNAPPPVIPVGGASKAGAPSIEDPNISTADFMELRAKQADERRRRYQR